MKMELLIHPDELTEEWIQRAANLKLDRLSLHPVGGMNADQSLEDLLEKLHTEEYRKLLDQVAEKGIEIGYEFHAAGWLLPRSLYNEHPEYFRMDESGNRTPEGNFCFSNEEAMQIVEDRAVKLAEQLYRNGDEYYFWLDDARNLGCHCPKCKGIAASDQQMRVMNRLVKALRRKMPNAKMVYLAYQDALKTPEKERPEEGIFLEYAPIDRKMDKPLRTEGIKEQEEIQNMMAYFKKYQGDKMLPAKVLEYWYDNSLFSGWKKPFSPYNGHIIDDIRYYLEMGFENVASFACYFGKDYTEPHGEPDFSAWKLLKLQVVKEEEVLKGWSGERKFCMELADGTKYLKRTTNSGNEDKKEKEYRCMQQVSSLRVPMCDPYDFCRKEWGTVSIQKWIDGEDAEQYVPTLPESEQYRYGVDAGKILKQIHSIPAPDDQPAWEARFNKKMDRKIQGYLDCPLRLENGDLFIRFIEENRHLLKDRPQCFQHGDYHIGNMIIGHDGKQYVIDFNRFDYGDPWEEFNRIVWSAAASPLYATGVVDGYFAGEIPMEFWKLLALYIASNTLSALPWAIPFGEKDIQTMRNQARDVLNWYDNMRNPVPTWYVKEAKEYV